MEIYVFFFPICKETNLYKCFLCNVIELVSIQLYSASSSSSFVIMYVYQSLIMQIILFHHFMFSSGEGGDGTKVTQNVALHVIPSKSIHSAR